MTTPENFPLDIEPIELPEVLIYSKDQVLGAPDYKKPKRIIEDEYIDLSILQTVNQICLAPDNGVIKYLIQEGDPLIHPYELPKIGCIVHLQYESRKNDGKLTDIYRDRKEIRKIKLFKDNLIPGINIAISSMLKNEISWFKFEPKYHYYSEENNEIRVNCDGEVMIQQTEPIYYKIHLIDYKNIEQLDNMNFEGRIKKLEDARIRGNNLFNKSDFEKANKLYNDVLGIIRGFPKKLLENLSFEQKNQLDFYYVAIFGNACLIKQKLKKHYEALKFADEGLKYCQNNPKLMFRKGQTLLNLSEFDKALECFEFILEKDPQNQETINKVIQLKEKRKFENFNEKKTFKKVFELWAEDEQKEIENKKIMEKIVKKQKIDQEKSMIIEQNMDLEQNNNFFFENELKEFRQLQKGIIIDTTQPNILDDSSDKDIDDEEFSQKI